MAITNKEEGVWSIDQVFAKQNQGSIWDYDGALGTWFNWGRNNYGNLGQNNRTEYSSPVQVGSDATWANGCQSLGGEISSHGIKTDGTLWSWGWNNGGFVGVNNRTQYSSPVQVPGTTWARIVGGTDQIIATKTNGTLWSWGYNSYGQLCTGNDTHRSSPTQIPGTTWGTGRKTISSTGRSVLAVRSDGTLWSWGGNASGRGGTNQAPGGSNQYFTSPRQIPGATWSLVEAGPGSGMAIKTDGTLWGWGANWNGHLGQNSIGNGGSGPAYHGYSSPVQIPGTTWKDIAMTHENDGGYVAIKTDGTMWAWGNGSTGQLGLNSTTKFSSPVQIPGTTWDIVDGIGAAGATARKTDGTLWTWGNSSYGGLGNNTGPGAHRSSPIQIPGTDWKVTVRGSSKDSPLRAVIKQV
jgi:alpha-tubulin suppressor-like RCC1 family protein